MPELSPITCYKKRCGHAACREAWNAYSRNRTRLRAYGRLGRGWVNAEPVRQHVRALGRAGMGEVRVAAVSGVSEGTLRALLRGEPKRGLGPTKRMRQWRAEALLAVRLDLDLLADGTNIDATGTCRRLQALAAIGWPTGRLAEALDRDVRVVTRTRSAESVTARTARDVRDLYERLWDQEPPLESPWDRNASVRARNLAARNGWAKPMEWDHIDDPDEEPSRPQRSRADVDPIAVELALKGKKVPLNHREVAEAVRIGTSRRLSAAQLAKVTGRSPRTVQRRRAA